MNTNTEFLAMATLRLGSLKRYIPNSPEVTRFEMIVKDLEQRSK